MAILNDPNDASRARENDLWIFRDGRKSLPSSSLVQQFRSAAEVVLRSPDDHGALLDALIRAGELEAALVDSAEPAAAVMIALTDALASAAFSRDTTALSQELALLASVRLPQSLTISPPEGFSYYALQPLDFGHLAVELVPGNGPVAVIGIRSIGTTLSAVVMAALRAPGKQAERITVRPTGHPYDRHTRFTPEQQTWIAANRGRNAIFLVVDEGPGRSGSTFLSVAEALLEAGIHSRQIRLIGSRAPDPRLLCAHDAAQRWSRFQFVFPEHRTSRFKNHFYVAAGEWRRFFLPDGYPWPGSWTQMERLKFLSPDKTRLFKFEGLGRIGKAVQCRSRRVAEAGFGCPVEDVGDGFSGYVVPTGRALKRDDISTAMLERMAQYCAFRTREFLCEDAFPEGLADMLRFNVATEFQTELHNDLHQLFPERLTLVDGRMQPYEWLVTTSGTLLKTDASTHGDDHFFPGPIDIAWDLAGAVVEWNLSPHAIDFLVSRFQALTGDDPRRRLPIFMLAYTVFRMASCKMAITTVAGSTEGTRLRRAYHSYRRRAVEQLKAETANPSVISLPSREPVRRLDTNQP